MRFFLAAFLVVLLASCATWQSDPTVGTRFIDIGFAHTKERVRVQYATDGSYDDAALDKISYLMRDHVTGEVRDIDPRLINFIVDIRRRLALPEDMPIEVLSGFRSPERNAELAKHDRNVARESWHTKGKAADFRMKGVSGKAIAEIAKTAQKGGVAYYPKTNHVHVDIGGIRSWKAK
ncbi:MAG: DUF882 domain-containing protein [Alphaproteobacteria bacterium]|nr:DUF882 domain-containing protein [Alphaproteobacteria bacterium]